ncbi:MAG TPA: hypothetical protein VN737_07470 [Bryobacteraceae bacterium]|nr:hypothetical protein [Bryobacteraceae bacterium]
MSIVVTRKGLPLVLVALMLAATGVCEEGGLSLKSLIGRKAIVQRVPMYEPGTYKTISSTHAGQEVTIIGFKPVAVPQMAFSSQVLSRLSADQRAALEDARNAGTLVVQFADGTKADSGVIMPSLLANYFELEGEPVSEHPEPASTARDVHSIHSGNIGIQPQVADELSDEEVNMAIQGEGRAHRVSIEDMGLLAAQGARVPRISIYMPEALLALKSDSAKGQFQQYTPSEEDRRRSVTIVASGYVGETIADGCNSITRVVLVSDPSGRSVQEAYLSGPVEETWRNAFGGTAYCQSLTAKFTLEGVRKVQSAAPNGEFFVAVFAGDVNTKMYKIKRKHQIKLGLK